MRDERVRHWISEFNELGLFKSTTIPPDQARPDVEEIHEAAAVIGVCVYGTADTGYLVHSKI